MLEVVVQKGLFYFFQIGDASILDLIAFTGYKFVVLCPIAAAELLIGYYGSYCVMLVLAGSFALFFYRTLGRYNTQNTLAAHM